MTSLNIDCGVPCGASFDKFYKQCSRSIVCFQVLSNSHLCFNLNCVSTVSSLHNCGVLSSNRIPVVNFTPTKKSGVHVQVSTVHLAV